MFGRKGKPLIVDGPVGLLQLAWANGIKTRAEQFYTEDGAACCCFEVAVGYERRAAEVLGVEWEPPRKKSGQRLVRGRSRLWNLLEG